PEEDDPHEQGRYEIHRPQWIAAGGLLHGSRVPRLLNLPGPHQRKLLKLRRQRPFSTCWGHFFVLATTTFARPRPATRFPTPARKPKMRTQYYTATSIDGYIADRNNSLDWLFRMGDAGNDDYGEFIAQVGAVAMGSTTYQWVYDHLIGPRA